MKCKKCGHVSRTLPAMAAHYRKAHGKKKPKQQGKKKKA